MDWNGWGNDISLCTIFLGGERWKVTVEGMGAMDTLGIVLARYNPFRTVGGPHYDYSSVFCPGNWENVC